jgi:hypothetical protein
VSGVIASGAATLDPLFTIDAELQSGTGSHVVNVLDSNGAVLASSRFTPASPDAEASGPRIVGPPRFTVVVPKPAGAASLEIRSDTDALLGTVTLGGAAPSVQLVAPTAPGVLSGNVLLTWAITDPDSTSHLTRVQYSTANAGQTWSDLGVVDTNELVVNFDRVARRLDYRVPPDRERRRQQHDVNRRPVHGAEEERGHRHAFCLPAANVARGAPGLIFLEGTGNGRRRWHPDRCGAECGHPPSRGRWAPVIRSVSPCRPART